MCDPTLPVTTTTPTTKLRVGLSFFDRPARLKSFVPYPLRIALMVPWPFSFFERGCLYFSGIFFIVCRTPFNPGNRVTVWKDEFLCVCCSQSLSTASRNDGAGITKTAPSVTSSSSSGSSASSPHKPTPPPPHRLSFAEQPSPAVAQTTTAASKMGDGIFLKSSLRQSHTMPPPAVGTSNGNGVDYTKKGGRRVIVICFVAP